MPGSGYASIPGARPVPSAAAGVPARVARSGALGAHAAVTSPVISGTITHIDPARSLVCLASPDATRHTLHNVSPLMMQQCLHMLHSMQWHPGYQSHVVMGPGAHFAVGMTPSVRLPAHSGAPLHRAAAHHGHRLHR